MRSDLSSLNVGDKFDLVRGALTEPVMHKMQVTRVGKKWLRAFYVDHRSWGEIEFEIATGIAHGDSQHTKRRPSIGFRDVDHWRAARERYLREIEVMELLRLGWRLERGVAQLGENTLFELLRALGSAKDYANL